MKKIIFSFITVFIFSLCSCDFLNITNDKDSSSSITAPVIETKSDGLVISPTQVTGTVYLNIFRYEVDGATDSASIVANTTQNIGQVTLATINGSLYSGSILFTDYYTSTSKYYQYFVRYKTSSAYKTSAVSGTYKGAGSAGEKSITNKTANTPFQITLDNTQYILSVKNSDITMPAPLDASDSFDLMVGLNNGTNTILFPMTYDSGNSQYTVSLRNVLPDTFIAVPLTMKCIIGQTDVAVPKGTNDTTTIYTLYHWTSPLSAEATVNSTAVDDFTMPKNANESGTIDFTPTANQIGSVGSEIVILPVLE